LCRTDSIRSGFTLLELLVVTTLMVLLAGVTIWTLRSELHRTQWETTLNSIENLDQKCRGEAQRSGRPVIMLIDTAAGRLWQARADDPEQAFSAAREVRLPSGFVIDRLRTASVDQAAGTLAIKIEPDRRAESYALRISGPGERAVWLLTAGWTGYQERWTEPAAEAASGNAGDRNAKRSKMDELFDSLGR